MSQDENYVHLAFYNLENFFDTKNHPHILDDDFTPDGFKNWTPKRYKRKLKKVAKAIQSIGLKTLGTPPAVIGLAEVENKVVLNDLVNSKWLLPYKYQYVHFDSPDERGIDVALLYRESFFKIALQKRVPLQIFETDGIQDHTRDILHVSGTLQGEKLDIFVNHWPSRRSGDQQTDHKRIAAAKTLSTEIERVRSASKPNNIVVMGDFNDDPHSPSIRELVRLAQLYNPMDTLIHPERGSARYKKIWTLFDQILVSHDLLNYSPESHQFIQANIHNPKSLQEWKPRFKGKPFRTYLGKKYLGGVSDHFPVYITLKYHEE